MILAVVAGGTGYWLGKGAERTSEEVAASVEAANAPASGLEQVIAGEGRKVIRNMWLSEILEQNR